MITIERTKYKEWTSRVKVFKDQTQILDELANGSETNHQAHCELEDIVRVVDVVAKALGAEVTEILTTIK